MIGGITDAHWQQILSIFRKHPNITDVILYGSRAKGTFREGSDIDVAIKGGGITHHQLAQLDTDYEQLYLPWKLDVTIYETVANPDLKAHIDRVGVRML